MEAPIAIIFTSDSSGNGWGFELSWSCLASFDPKSTSCSEKIEISNSEYYHNNDIYNDVYLLSATDGDKPVYKSVGQFPLKIVKWDSSRHEFKKFCCYDFDF